MRNLHNLDMLRAFAVTLVLVDHTSWALGRHLFWGWETAFVGVFGVYLFFVHTALVLMGSMERYPGILPFYIRRMFRIFPLAVTAILVSLIFRIPVSTGGTGYTWIHFSGSTILANVLLVQDLFHRPNIVGVMWTLTIEVQMYVLLPALFLVAAWKQKIWPLVVLWCLAVLECHAYFPTPSNILPTVIPDFIPGVIAYVGFKKYRPKLSAWAFLPFVCFLLFVYMLRPGPHLSWPLALTLGLALPWFRQISGERFVSINQKVAQYSYGIYLWHPFGIELAFNFLRGPWLRVTGELAFTAVASGFSYHLIEKPLIDFGNRLVTRTSVLKQGSSPCE